MDGDPRPRTGPLIPESRAVFSRTHGGPGARTGGKNSILGRKKRSPPLLRKSRPRRPGTRLWESESRGGFGRGGLFAHKPKRNDFSVKSILAQGPALSDQAQSAFCSSKGDFASLQQRVGVLAAMVARRSTRALALTALALGSADAYSFGLAPAGAGVRFPALRPVASLRSGVRAAPLRMQVKTEEKKSTSSDPGFNSIATSAAVSPSAPPRPRPPPS